VVVTDAPLIDARGLAIGYGGRVVAHDIDVTLRPGEVVCLLGPNGSGKTTLFKTLLGLIPRLAGSIAIAGRSIESWRPGQLALRQAYVPQANVAVFPYRVLDMVLMGRTARLGLFAAPGEADREKAWGALGLLGIAHLAEREYTRVSGGQRQLALIARALAQEAPAIVMDEPTASLDFGNQALVLREVARLARSGLGIVLSTHHPDHAFAVAGRVLLLSDGRVIADGAPGKVLTPERLERVYGVPVTVDSLPDGRISCMPLMS
jgi:iron complex transport system ATP-binding protein